jgi:hypothetical protein
MSRIHTSTVFVALIACTLSLGTATSADAGVSVRYFDDYIPLDHTAPADRWDMPYRDENIGSPPQLTRNGQFAYGTVARADGHHAYIWNLVTDQVSYLPMLDTRIAALSDDGRIAVLTAHDQPAALYDVTSQTILHANVGPVGGRAAVINADGSRFATEGVTIWDGLDVYDTFPANPTETPIPLSMSADGSRVLAEVASYFDVWQSMLWVDGSPAVTHSITTASLMTSDGSQVYGLIGDTDGWDLARWTEQDGWVSLAVYLGRYIPGRNVLAGVSADGGVVAFNFNMVMEFFYDIVSALWLTDGTVHWSLLHYLQDFGAFDGPDAPGLWGRVYAMSDDAQNFIVATHQLDVHDHLYTTHARLALVTIPEPGLATWLIAAAALALVRRGRGAIDNK